MDKELNILPPFATPVSKLEGSDEYDGHYPAQKVSCAPTIANDSSPECKNSRLLAGTWIAFICFLVVSWAVTANVITQKDEKTLELARANSALNLERIRLVDEEAKLKSELKERGIEPTNMLDRMNYRGPYRNANHELRSTTERRWEQLGREMER